MSLTVKCDRCKKIIPDVVWVLTAVSATTMNLAEPYSTKHLHWECINAKDSDSKSDED